MIRGKQTNNNNNNKKKKNERKETHTCEHKSGVEK